MTCYVSLCNIQLISHLSWLQLGSLTLGLGTRLLASSMMWTYKQFGSQQAVQLWFVVIYTLSSRFILKPPIQIVFSKYCGSSSSFVAEILNSDSSATNQMDESVQYHNIIVFSMNKRTLNNVYQLCSYNSDGVTSQSMPIVLHNVKLISNEVTFLLEAAMYIAFFYNTYD